MWEPLVDPKIILMHIKLKLIMQFVKALNKKSAVFKFLRFFSKLFETKSKVKYLLNLR